MSENYQPPRIKRIPGHHGHVDSQDPRVVLAARPGFDSVNVQLIPAQQEPARRFDAPSGFDDATQAIEIRSSDSKASLDEPLTGNFADMLGQVQEKQKIRDQTKKRRGLGRVTRWLR